MSASAHDTATHDTRVADEHRGDHHEEAPHGSFRGYVTGFVLSVILTAVPFWLVMTMPLASPALTAFLVVSFAVVQIMVHMVFFLHMNTRSEGGWTFMALMFTLVVLVITLAGTMWVMYNLDVNMMPSHDMSQMP